MTATDNKETGSNVTEVLKSLLEKNQDGGEVNITVLEKQLPNMTRSEIIRALRKTNVGAFITGRRGKPSRFIYGAQAIPHLHKAPAAQRQVSPARRESVESVSGDGHGLELRVNVGGTITTIPIKLELGVAA